MNDDKEDETQYSIPFSVYLKKERNMTKHIYTSSDGLAAVGIHLLVSLYVVASPVLLMGPSDSITLTEYMQRIVSPLFMCVVFYSNFFCFVPKLFLQKRYWQFFAINAALLLLIAYMHNLYINFLCDYWLSHGDESKRRFALHVERRHKEIGSMVLFWKGYVSTMLSHLIVVVIAVSARISLQWNKAEKARQQAEIGLREAELQNLRNQINPHFLLNTLNNIYSLTAFDTYKAQEGILKLSSLLRYVLYKDKSSRVELQKEIDFLMNYIDLMKMRLTDNTEVLLSVNCPNAAGMQVAPLIFISLVENAFKHGVSPNEISFIHISMATTDNGKIIFCCTNSNHPKAKNDDKSPQGIGLQQVSRRLEHNYPNAYIWTYGINDDATIYSSSIEIDTTPRDQSISL